MAGKPNSNMDASFQPALLLHAPTTEEQRADAIEVLKNLNENGRLKPIEGWRGSTLSGYMDILGLNERPMIGNERYNMGVQSATPDKARVKRYRPKGTVTPEAG